MKLNNKISAVVTGAASGLGEATARGLAEKDVKVTIFDLNEDLGSAVAQEINGHFAKVDVSDPQSVADGFSSARRAHGQERIIVNCAGICPGSKTVSKGVAHDPDLFAKTIKINLVGSFLTSSQSAAGMASLDPLEGEERGVIINTASIASFEGQVGQVAYASSKGGVVGMTLPLARDLAPLGIRAMAIAPGIFKTPMLESLPDEVQQELGARLPFPSRLGDPSEYAQLAVHITENAMLNGDVIRIDAAFRMPPR